MVMRFMIKEWKERRHIALLACVVVLGFFVLLKVYPDRPEITDFLAGALFLVVFPSIALLVGAGGFSSELQSGTWRFLTSRPVPKWKIWLVKYLASLILVLAVLGVFTGVTFLFPQAKNILATVPFEYGVYGGLSFFSLGLLLSLFLFHAAFSLSFLSAKPSIIIVALAILAVLAVLFFAFYNALQVFYPYLAGLRGILIFISVSFAGASLLTFLKADLSQPKKARGLFSKYAAAFVAVSLILSAGLTWISGSFIGPRKFVWNLTYHESKVFFTSNRGVVTYDPVTDEARTLGKRSWRVMPFSLSLGGDKVALLNYNGWRGMTQELWVMNVDGTQMRLLASARMKNSPFFDHYFSQCRISADGRKIALITIPKGKGFSGNYPWVLWWMNADGTEPKSVRLWEPLNPKGAIEVLGWTKSDAGLIMYQFAGSDRRSAPKMVVFDLSSGTGRVVVENLPVFSLNAISPLRDYFVRDFRDDRDKKKVISIIDLNTLAETEIQRAEGLDVGRIRWTPDGEAFVFLDWQGETRPEKYVLGIYSVREGKILGMTDVAETPLSPLVFPDIDWVDKGAALAFGPVGKDVACVDILSPDLKIKRRYPFPQSVKVSGAFAFLGAGPKVVVGVGPDKDLWRLDLATGGWRKIY